MNLLKYQQKTSLTAVYPEKYAVLYLALGLTSEIGEIAGKQKKIIRDDNCKYSLVNLMNLGMELGDAMWYVSEICNTLNIELSISESNTLNIGLCPFQTADISGIHIQVSEICKIKVTDISIDILKLSTMCSSFAFVLAMEHSDLGQLKSHADELKHLLSLITRAIYSLATDLKLHFSTILDDNIGKLQQRKKTNTIKGSGDHR